MSIVFIELRFRRIGVDVEDEDLAALETGEPELAAIVGEPAVMRLVAALDRVAVDDFAVAGRAGLHVDGDEFVRAVAETFDAERPDIDELLLPFDAGQVGRGAGFIGARSAQAESESERECARKDAT